MSRDRTTRPVNTAANGLPSGMLPLEAFERGVKLTRACQATLKQAELRIQTLSAQNQDIVPTEESSTE